MLQSRIHDGARFAIDWMIVIASPCIDLAGQQILGSSRHEIGEKQHEVLVLSGIEYVATETTEERFDTRLRRLLAEQKVRQPSRRRNRFVVRFHHPGHNIYDVRVTDPDSIPALNCRLKH